MIRFENTSSDRFVFQPIVKISSLIFVLSVAGMAFLSLGDILLSEETGDALLDKVYFSLVKIQTPSGILATDGAGYCHTASQALASSALLERGHLNRARRILDFYEDIRISESESEEGFKGFSSYYDIKSRSAIAPKTIKISTPVAEISHFANASVAVAALNYRRASGDKRFDKLIKALADGYLKNINAWGLYSDKKSPSSLEENLAALSVLVCAASVEKLSRQDKNLFTYIKSIFSKNNKNSSSPTEKEERYLKALKRLRFALLDIMYDGQRKLFRENHLESSPLSDETAQVFAAMVLDKNTFSYQLPDVKNRPPENVVKVSGIRRACFAALLLTDSAQITASSPSVKTALLGYIDNLISKKKDDSSALFLIKSATPVEKFFFEKGDYAQITPPYDILATVIYVFSKLNKNPFHLVSSAIDKDVGIISEEFLSLNVTRGEKWKEDTFEGGEEVFYAVENQSLKNADFPSDGIFSDDKIRKEGERSLKFRFITRQSKDGKSQGTISRFFYPSQDFTLSGKFSFLKCWINARPATFTLGATNLKIRIRLTDEYGVSADSKNLNYSGRGVENKIAFPAGFTPVSPARVPDYSKVKKISFILEEETQTTWDINLDNLRIE